MSADDLPASFSSAADAMVSRTTALVGTIAAAGAVAWLVRSLRNALACAAAASQAAAASHAHARKSAEHAEELEQQLLRAKAKAKEKAKEKAEEARLADEARAVKGARLAAGAGAEVMVEELEKQLLRVPVGTACRTTLREPGALFTHACSQPYQHKPATLWTPPCHPIRSSRSSCCA